jgi:hypothetical protein
MDNKRLATITGNKQLIEETKLSGPEQDDAIKAPAKITDREDEYH